MNAELNEYLAIAALLYNNWKDHKKVEKKILITMGHDKKSFAKLEGEAIRQMEGQESMKWGEFTVELRRDLPDSPEALKYALKPKPFIVLHKK
jgi:hypothetical protein